MTHASLFSGIGGPDVAAAMLGWDNLFHCEINEFGRRVLDYWFPNSMSYEDITKTDFSEWRGKVDVLTGGFPCQPFSYAGKRRGADDDRYLWPYMFKAIDQIRPTWIVAENVAGITTMVEHGDVSEVGGQASMFEEVDGLHRYRLTETFTLQRICDDLEGHGYSVQPVLVPACAVGAPHRRDRVFIVANRSLMQRDGSESGKRWRREEISELGDNNSKGISTADAESEQGGRCELGQPRCSKPQQGQPGGRGGEDDAERNAADTYGKRPDKPDIASDPGQPQRLDSQEDHTSGTAGLGRWDSFPAVSPVHRGNDGLSLPPYYYAIYERRNSMDRNSVILGALRTKKIEVDYATGDIYSTRIRGHEGERIKLQGSDCNGYIVHTLSFNGIKKQCRAHQIVWIAANGDYDKNKFQIDHKNRNRKDNRLENLHLVTAAENIANSDRPDTRILNDEGRYKIWKLYNEGNNSIREIAEDFGVSKSLVYNIIHEFPDLSIPFSKWRTESLKAYGNAIVPQVMYEIFRAIDIITNQ